MCSIHFPLFTFIPSVLSIKDFTVCIQRTFNELWMVLLVSDSHNTEIKYIM